MKGVIKTYVPEKKYGFIKGDDEKDYFFHLGAFKDPRHKDKICDEMLVEFEPTPTPKGYRAQNCSLLDPSDVTTFAVPDEFLTSKEMTIKGWEIIEMGDWIVHGSSRASPDEARKDLIDSAMRVKANALVDTTYYRTTGSEAGTGKGIHHYTIHNFRARIVIVARRSPKGEYRADELCGLNQRAEAEKQWLLKLNNQSKRKRHILWAVIIGLSAILLAIGDDGGGIFIVIFISVLVGLAFGRSTDYDYWLQRACYA